VRFLIPARHLPFIPALGVTAERATITLYAAIRHIRSGWVWFVAEVDPATGAAFGWVHGHEDEWGDFDLKELAEMQKKGEVFTDLAFSPMIVDYDFNIQDNGGLEQ
tara:strand:+ start:1873 stop:2190 length:318 start_codon:yes stop_codon:yes gene_type:complete